MNAFLLSLHPEASVADQWCYGFLKDFLEGQMWKPPGWKDFDIKVVNKLSKCDRAVVAIPASYHPELIDELNAELSKIGRVVLFLIGDEEAVFPTDKLKHSSMEIWVQYPHPSKHDKYHKLGTGYPHQLRDIAKNLSPEKLMDVFFSGQVTHHRRHEAWGHILGFSNTDHKVDVNRTVGFTKGIEHRQYYSRMARSKVVPCPSGPVTPDTFRLFEALELMAIPIADEKNPAGTIDGYWEWLLGEQVPFPLLKEWSSFHGYTVEVLNQWPTIMHRTMAWYLSYKRAFAYKVMEQINV